MEGPRQREKQLKRRIYDIGSRVRPANAKLAKFLAQFSNKNLVVATLGFSPAESGCLKPWEVLFAQGDREMATTGKDTPDRSDQQVALSDLWGALTSLHPREQTSDPQMWAPRYFIYPNEIADFMESIKSGR
jgi:hypothetical protein